MNTLQEVTATAVAAASHTEAAQARVDELRAMRETIPNFTVPLSPRDGQRMATVASVPPEFIELAAMVVKNEEALTGGWAQADAMRDLVTFARAYDPVADEFEAMGQFLRHSTTAARNKAGRAALLVYALIKRMAKMPEHAHLAPYVADMSRALGMRERFARARAAAARRKAEAEAAEPVTAPPPMIETPPHA